MEETLWPRKRHVTWECHKNHTVAPYQVYDEFWRMNKWVRSEKCFQCEFPKMLEEFYAPRLMQELKKDGFISLRG